MPIRVHRYIKTLRSVNRISFPHIYTVFQSICSSGCQFHQEYNLSLLNYEHILPVYFALTQQDTVMTQRFLSYCSSMLHLCRELKLMVRARRVELLMLSHLGLNQAPMPIRVYPHIMSIFRHSLLRCPLGLSDNLDKVSKDCQKNYHCVVHFYDAILMEVLRLAKKQVHTTHIFLLLNRL